MKQLLVHFGLLLFMLDLSAQHRDFSVIHEDVVASYNIETIYDFDVSADGIVWIATDKGLVSFTGSRPNFKTIRNKQGDVLMPKLVDAEGTPCFATLDGSVGIIKDSAMVSVSALTQSLPVWIKEREGVIHVLYQDASSFLINVKDGKVISSKNSHDETGVIYKVHDLDFNRLLIQSEVGAFVFDISNSSINLLDAGEDVNLKPVDGGILGLRGDEVSLFSIPEMVPIQVADCPDIDNVVSLTTIGSKKVMLLASGEVYELISNSVQLTATKMVVDEGPNATQLNGAKSIDGKLWYYAKSGGLGYLQPELLQMMSTTQAEHYIFDLNPNLFLGLKTWAANEKVALAESLHKLQATAATIVLDQVFIGNELGLFAFDRKSAEISTVSLNTGTVNHILASEERGLIISTATKGILLFDQELILVNSINVEQGLRKNYVYQTTLGENENLWIAGDGGLYEYNMSNQKLDKIELPEFSVIKSLAYNATLKQLVAVESGLGVYWVTNDSVNYSQLELLKGRQVHHLIKSGNGYWACSDNLLFHLDNNSVIAQHPIDANVLSQHVKSVGFDPTRSTILISADNKLFEIDEQELLRREEVPSFAVNAFELNGEIASRNELIDLTYDHYTIQASFIISSFAQDMTISYRLKGLHDNWIEIDDKSDVTYTLDKEGEYVFEAYAENSEGVKSNITSYEVKIDPPIYHQPLFYILILLALIIIGAFALIIRDRQHKKVKAVLERIVEKKTREITEDRDIIHAQKDQIEKYTNDLIHGLEYARSLQVSISPDPKPVLDKMADSFVINQPKDIVSGDFHWFHKKGEKLVIAAADCTGHGVRGAMMSLLGFRGLDEAVEHVPNLEPNKLWVYLNNYVYKNLHSDSNRNEELADGMDIAITTIDFSEKKLHFCGAKNNIYLIRPGHKLEIENQADYKVLNERLIELKASRLSTASEIITNSDEVPMQEVNLKEADRFYLFSDGFADQFGGPRNKKFGYRKVKNILTDTHELGMQEQSNTLLEEHRNWRGSKEQTDDILFVGVQIPDLNQKASIGLSSARTFAV